MFKWHVHSAIGRGRPAAHDLTRVADGIAASLRQFSISASRCAEEDGNGDALRTNRSSKTADALAEVSSLNPSPSRGIDARSLAAKPPVSFTIRRVDEGFQPRGRGGSSFVRRGGGDFRGGRPAGNRGGLRQRGGGKKRGATRGRGRGRGKGKREIRPKQEEDGAPDPYTAEELEYIDHSKGGFDKPYTPVTSAEDLARWGPPVISSPRGVVETIAWKMAVATDNQNPEFKSASVHHLKIMNGAGTLFENAAEREKAKEVFGKAQTLSKSDQEAMLKQWAAGQYVKPHPVQQPGDVLAHVAAYTRRNETYLPADARKLEEKLRSLLPATIVKPQPKAVKRPL